jgi:hypothetical protein
MGSLRPRARVVLFFLLACLLAVSAISAMSANARTRTLTLTFTTGQFVVNCTSSGQRCSPKKKLTFTLGRNGTLTSIKYTAAATHCSSALLRVFRKGRQIAKTGRLEPGETSERLVTHIGLAKGETTLRFQAQGFVGGCNTGYVGSWGGKITVAVKVPRR